MPRRGRRSIGPITRTPGVPDKRRSNKPVLWGQPQKGKSKKRLKREKKIEARQEKQMERDAHKAVGWVRSVAAAKFDPAGERKFRDHRLGTFGPPQKSNISTRPHISQKKKPRAR
jgi:hypothetical protein